MADKNQKKGKKDSGKKARRGLLEGALGTAARAARSASEPAPSTPTSTPTSTPAPAPAPRSDGARTKSHHKKGRKGSDTSAFAVTVDVAVFTIHAGRFCVLLIERGVEPFKGMWAIPGGFVRPEEDLEEAARRELEEETGIGHGAGLHLEQLRTYGDPGRDPRMRVVSVAYVAITPELPEPRGGTDAAAAALHPVEGLPPLAFDHADVLADAVERVRSKLEYTPLAAAFCPSPFTLAELRRVYEIVWNERLDPANFQRKVLNTPGFVEPTGEMSSSGPSGGRPARLFVRGEAEGLHPAMLRRG